MKLLPKQTSETFLSVIGEEARTLLMRRDYSGLANRFGYALAYDRLPSVALEADFLSAVASPITAASGAYLPDAITVNSSVNITVLSNDQSAKGMGQNMLAGAISTVLVNRIIGANDGRIVFPPVVLSAEIAEPQDRRGGYDTP
jgi:hypothetical protein